MASISDITEELINTAVATDDLTDALFNLQRAIGVDAGDVAARVFGFGWDEEWPGATTDRRREMMDHYIELERLYAPDADDDDDDTERAGETTTCLS